MPSGIYKRTKPVSEETRKKISESEKGNKGHNFGKHHSEETKRKMSLANKGRHHSQETRKKMSESHKGLLVGRKHSEETKRKMSEARKGKRTWNWKGGISHQKDYGRDYQRDYLRKVRLAVIDTLGSKCVRCGFSDIRALQIDHINGGGSKERKERGFSINFHRYVIKSVLNKENKYQLLCANCNWIKRFENKE